MRVLHLHFGKEGGAERFFVNLANAFASRGVEQKFIIRPNRSWEQDIAPLGSIIRNNFSNLSPLTPVLHVQAHLLVKRWQPDAVMAWMPRAGRLMKSWPGVVKLARMGDFPKNLKHFKHCDVLIGNVPGIAQTCRQLGWQKPVQTISNFPRNVTPVPVERTVMNTPPGAFIVSASGRFVPRKGFDTLIKAVAQVPGIWLWLLGDGQEKQVLEKLCVELGIQDRVRFADNTIFCRRLRVQNLQYEYIEPDLPGFGRWRRLTAGKSGLSVLRMMEYEALKTVPLSGRVLDVGGGQKAKYLELLPKGIELRSVNIDPDIAPTDVIEPNSPLPFSDNSFDSVLCLNTLEHIYDAKAVLHEIHRVLKPGGQIYVMVPFMFRIHGHPDDYFRATPSWWQETFKRVGFSSMKLKPLVWGRATTATIVPGHRGVFRTARLHIAAFFDILTARMRFSGQTYSGKKASGITNTSPGWYMSGKK